MCAVMPVGVSLIDQLQVDLIDERGGLERMPRALTTHLVLSEAAQFAFDKWDQPVEGGRVAFVPRDEEIGHALSVHSNAFDLLQLK